MPDSTFHECEEVILQSDRKLPCQDLWNLLSKLDFRLHDDVFSIDRPRKPKIPLWQPKAVLSVYNYCDEAEIYDPGLSWNRIVCKYYLALMPREWISVFCNKVYSLSQDLAIPTQYQSRVIIHDELLGVFNDFADKLTAEFDEPGSEGLAMLIHLDHQSDG